MSILNNSRPNLLVVQFKYLQWKPKIKKDDLVAVCAPQEVVNNKANFINTLNAAIEIGLFSEQNGELNIAPSLDKKVRSKKDGLNHLPQTVCKLIMETDGASMWKEANSDPGGRDFIRMLSWSLAQDICKFPKEYTTIERMRNRQCSDHDPEQIIQNSTRWQPFLSWARFLGFGNGTKIFTPDPTGAIKTVLPEVFSNNQSLGCKSFLGGLRKELPVLDGGSCRVAMEQTLDSQVWSPPQDGRLSMSLSLALVRLHEQKIIRVRYENDSPDYVQLTGVDGKLTPIIPNFSHIDLTA